MKDRIRVGSRISTEAWQFNEKCSNENVSWSFKLFGKNWQDSGVVGAVGSKTGFSGLFAGM